MMLSRRIPSASPGARGSPTRKPSASGPRCRIAPVIARTRASASALREANATPHIPHTLFFDLRRRKEGCARPHCVLPQVETRNSQALVGIPAKHSTHQQEERKCRGRGYEVKKGLALQKQAPINGFIPSRIQSVQQASQMKSIKRETRQAHMRKILEVVFTRIIRNGVDCFRKNRGIPQVLPRQI